MVRPAGAPSPRGLLLTPVRRTGAAVLGFVLGLAEVAALLWGALVSPLFMGLRGGRVVADLTVRQVYFTGVQGLPLVGLAALAIGTLLITEANVYLPVEYAARTAAIILVRDVVPIVVAVVVIGRSGTAISVELAGMRLGGQLEALHGMGMPLEHVIVLPRLLGCVASTLLLTVYALVVGIGGGYAISKSIGSLPFALEAMLDAVRLGDVSVALLKVLLFGAGVALVAVREGTSVRSSAREVPQATTRTVVRSMGACLVLNSAISVLA